MLVGNTVEVFGGDPRLHVFLEHGQHFGSQLAGGAHAFEVLGGFESNGHKFYEYGDKTAKNQPNLPQGGSPGYNFRVLQTASGHLMAHTAQSEAGL
ncbi:hypothetical protein GCM10007901_10790 [Dyella acidisoli]|uniref:Uncharacterized protein n=1 Tax=Dyella acidisoli TaxID=1867834 RepID=A0ABQ5XNQ3_9GAMM|nr:hypothetical protein GCM10007901_10790 [Dyella acidisoli]